MSPATGLRDPVERGTARLLAACLLGITLVFIALDASLMQLRDNYAPPWQGYALLGASYGLSRTRLFRYGAGITTVMFPVVAVSIVLTGDAQGVRAFSYALLAPFFAGLFLGIRGASVFAILTPVCVAVVPLFSEVGYAEVVDTLAANVMGGLVAVSYALHRDWVESRRQEVNARHEAELIQMQKMEALGRLAGGIAHDFNNLLTVIAGGVELLARAGDQKELRLIDAATRSAQGLTERLLSLSRQQVVQHASTDLRQVLDGTEQLLRRIIGEDIELSVTCAPDVNSVVLGVGQVQQILLNLATNARDAMPRGGRLSFSASNEGEDMVRLVVTDSGEGMDPSTAERVFEPFFTTKSMGEGTGLGLAMVFGLVNQVGGTIEVHSALGEGSSFQLRLPRGAPQADPSPVVKERRLTLGGTARGRILLVEDDAGVRELCRSVLRREGYEVTVAADPREALERVGLAESSFDLLITDIVMPGSSGIELSQVIHESEPGLPVLFISGYAPEDVVGDSLSAQNLLQKPFRPTDLLRRVSAVLYGLDSQSPPTSVEAERSRPVIPAAGKIPETSGALVLSEPPLSDPIESGARAIGEAGPASIELSADPKTSSKG